MRPLLLVVLTGRKSLNHEMSGSGLPLAAHSMVAVRVRSTTFSCGPMSMVGKPGGSWSSVDGCETHGREVTQLAAGTAGRSECVYFVSVLIFCFFSPTSGASKHNCEQCCQWALCSNLYKCTPLFDDRRYLGNSWYS